MEEYLEFAKEIAYGAGKIMLRYSKENKEISFKGDRTIVTKADKEINEYLIERVKETFPEHCVDGEEEQFGKNKYVWVCDPIDGTAMYARNIPVSVFSLALVIDGESKLGVVYDPYMDKIYTAIKGKGAYQNDKKIKVNDYKIDNIRSMGHFDLCSRPKYNSIKLLSKLREKTYTIDLGSIIRAGMCVATGDFTYAIFNGNKHKNCDIAAVKVIVEEAGGIVTNIYGEEQRYDEDINGAIICNKEAYEEVKNIINRRYKL